VYIFRNRLWETNEDIEFFTDAAVSIGMGIYVGANGHKLGGSKQEVQSNNITFLVLFPNVAALEMFGEMIFNKKVRFHCDNAAVVETNCPY
jgi:hypothetical protein